MRKEAMRILLMFHLFVAISGQATWKFRDGEPANLTVLGDTDNGCKFVLQTDEDRTCCYMNDTRQKHPDYNICGDQQSKDCISKSRFGVSEPKGQGKCILTLKKFQKSDAGTYNVEFPNERRKFNRIKKIEILERKYEIKEIVVGQTAITVFKGDIKEEGCRFEAHLSNSRVCCYEGKRRQSCKPENKCTEYRDSSSYEVKEDGNKCVLYLNDFHTSDVGEYEVIFPGDKHDNEMFSMKKAEETNWIVIILVFLVLLILIGLIVFRLVKSWYRKLIEDGKLTEGSQIFDALHNLNNQDFKERLFGRNILKVRDRNKNNLFHKVADKNWSAEMTVFLEHQCQAVFKQDNKDPEKREFNNYNKRQQIYCAKLPHDSSSWISKKSLINSWIIKKFGDGKMATFCQIMLPLTYIDLNSQNELGKTPLHIAAEKNELDIVKVLLDKEVDSSIRDNYHCTALQRAVLNQQYDGIRKPDNIEIVQLLLEKAGPMSKTVNGQNILHSAVMKNNLDVIKLIISSTAPKQQEQLLKERYSKEVTERKTKNKKIQWTGKTPLELAAKFGHNKIVEYLVDEDKLWKTEDQAWGMRSIYIAVSCCQKMVLNILVQNGGKFDPSWIVDDDYLVGDNCMRKVIRDKNPGAVNILLGFHLIKLDKSQIDDAIDFAKKEENELIKNENKENETGKKHLKNGTNKEKLTCIIKALQMKDQYISEFESDEEILEEIKKVQATKKSILKNIKTLEKEREEVKEKYKKDQLDDLMRDKAKEVQKELRLKSQLKKTKEAQEGPNILSLKTIKDRLRNIEEDESTINSKKMKQIMQLLEQTNKVTGNRDRAAQ